MSKHTHGLCVLMAMASCGQFLITINYVNGSLLCISSKGTSHAAGSSRAGPNCEVHIPACALRVAKGSLDRTNSINHVFSSHKP